MCVAVSPLADTDLDKALEYQLPLESVVTTDAMRGQLRVRSSRDVALEPPRADFLPTSPSAQEAGVGPPAKAAQLPGPPSLRVFASAAVSATLFLGLVVGLTFAELGDMSGALRGFLLVTASLSIALLTTISLSMIFPYKALASRQTMGSLFWSYSPHLLGALSGIWAAVWLSEVLTLGSDPLTGMWMWTIALGAPCAWLGVGLVVSYIAAIGERKREQESDSEGARESRQRIMVVHEQTRKEVAGLLHGRVQSRMVALGHWLKECQEQAKDGPREVVEGLQNVSTLLEEIRDQELRSITRQLYPSIIRMGLPSALNTLSDRFRSIFDIHLEISEEIATLESPVRPGLTESLRIALYRITEEALGNIAKHSQAKDAWVSLSLTPIREVLLLVRDNGEGFNPSEAYPGHGLLSMEDYAAGLGGNIEVDSSPDMGTTVKTIVPLC